MTDDAGAASYRLGTKRPSTAACPRCSQALAATGALEGALACAECGGVFLDTALVERLESDRDLDELVARTGAEVALIPFDSEVRYLRCPICAGTMNRATFGRKSGIVVDACKAHGTFFDAGELVAAVEFVASGAFARAQRAAAEAKAAERARVSAEVRALSQNIELSDRSSRMLEVLRRLLV